MARCTHSLPSFPIRNPQSKIRNRIMHTTRLDPRTLLSAYAQGVFPMGDRDGAIRFYTADPRGVIPLDAFHVPHPLAQLVRKPVERGGFEIRINHDFESTMRACMENRADGTWINRELV